MQEYAQAVQDNEREAALARRRTHLAHLFAALPSYGSAAYWRSIEEPELRTALPLEVIVKCIRTAVAYGDHGGRRRIFEILFRRIAPSNEYWARNVLNAKHIPADEQAMSVQDLYADICEGVIRAVIDPQRLFWEENFLHCLSFERRRVYQTFMHREGRLNVDQKQQGKRIPRLSLTSLDQSERSVWHTTYMLTIEDEVARKALLTVEHSDLPALVVNLPAKLKAVVLLIFWEDRTEKDAARILGITDRTVRNRLKHALELLYRKLEPEREMLHE